MSGPPRRTHDGGEATPEGPSDRGFLEAWWARPQVVAATLVLVAALAFVSWVRPRAVALPPNPQPEAVNETTTDRRDVTVYAVRDGVATPILLEVAAPAGASARLQAVVDGLRRALIDSGDWPAALPAPDVFALRIERDDAAVLDLPAHGAHLDVATERTILASLDRTLAEQGIDRIAYLTEGAPRDAWLGSVLAPSSLE